MRETLNECACVCVCVSVGVRACVWVCVHVGVRESMRAWIIKRNRRERKREKACIERKEWSRKSHEGCPNYIVLKAGQIKS